MPILPWQLIFDWQHKSPRYLRLSMRQWNSNHRDPSMMALGLLAKWYHCKVQLLVNEKTLVEVTRINQTSIYKQMCRNILTSQTIQQVVLVTVFGTEIRFVICRRRMILRRCELIVEYEGRLCNQNNPSKETHGYKIDTLMNWFKYNHSNFKLKYMHILWFWSKD